MQKAAQKQFVEEAKRLACETENRLKVQAIRLADEKRLIEETKRLANEKRNRLKMEEIQLAEKND